MSADIPGTTNIAGDILIFVENTKEHDKALTWKLERWDFKGITLNLEKSVFCKSNIEYYGFMQEIQDTRNTRFNIYLHRRLVVTDFRRFFCRTQEAKKIAKSLSIVQGNSPLPKKKLPSWRWIFGYSSWMQEKAFISFWWPFADCSGRKSIYCKQFR